MRLSRGSVVALVVVFSSSLVIADSLKEIQNKQAAAKAAIDAGTVVPERDLAPLIDMLRRSHDGDDQQHLVDVIVDLGEMEGSSPAAVKRYLREQATPLLIDIAGSRSSKNFLRGDAISGLRKLGAPRATLQQVADMALKDDDTFVQSRGEILANFIKSMPVDAPAATIKSADPARERDAIAFLKSHQLGVSLDQLTTSAAEGNAEEVAALLAAGVDPNGGPAGERPLDSAILGCSRHEGESAEILATVDALLSAGADVKEKDDNGNTPLFRAAQYCGAGVMKRLLGAGAAVNAVNGSGTTPLMLAFYMNHLDAAEMLAEKGATLTADQAASVSAMATTARAKAIIQKARSKKKSK